MRRRIWLLLVTLVVLSGVAALGWWAYDARRQDEMPVGILVASGRLEAKSVRVSSSAGGRVLRLAVKEGDPVVEGQLIAEIDARTYEAQVAAARSSVAAAEGNVDAIERRIAALETQVALAEKESGRYTRLVSRGAVPQQAADRAGATLEQLQQELRAVRAGLVTAQRQVEAVRAQQRTAAIQLEEARVLAPAPGRVADELVRAGEVVAPGMPLVRVARSEDVTLRVFLPIDDAQRVQPGMEARVYVDAFSDRFFAGTVERVATEAEFTPKDIHMPDERATLVFAVDIRVPNVDGALKNGFPADVYIRADLGLSWPERRPWQ